MREHKYQVWHKEEKHMYMLVGYDHIVDHDYTEPEREYSEQIQHVLYTPELPYCEKVWRADAADVEIREYTGLKDKHGKEGYHGDVVKLFDRSLFVIAWDDCYARFQLELVKGRELRKVWDMGMLQTGEIIGNIYANPDLLPPAH